MKVKEITYSKEFKRGLPQFSNITAGMHITIQYKEKDKPNHATVWEEINNELSREVLDVDPKWIQEEKPTYRKKF